MKIYVKNNDISKALRMLKRKLNQEGDIKKLREKEHFTPEGEKRRLEQKAGRSRWIKKRHQLERAALKKEQNPVRSKKPNPRTATQSKRFVATR
jgi:small subunit ribosomal protein S21